MPSIYCIWCSDLLLFADQPTLLEINFYFDFSRRFAPTDSKLIMLKLRCIVNCWYFYTWAYYYIDFNPHSVEMIVTRRGSNEKIWKSCENHFSCCLSCCVVSYNLAVEVIESPCRILLTLANIHTVLSSLWVLAMSNVFGSDWQNTNIMTNSSSTSYCIMIINIWSKYDNLWPWPCIKYVILHY